jgi:hypothetical protein
MQPDQVFNKYLQITILLAEMPDTLGDHAGSLADRMPQIALLSVGAATASLPLEPPATNAGGHA